MERLLRISEVQRTTGLSKANIYRKIAIKEFPSPVPLVDSGKAVGWVSSEIQKWIAGRIEARETATS